MKGMVIYMKKFVVIVVAIFMTIMVLNLFKPTHEEVEIQGKTIEEYGYEVDYKSVSESLFNHNLVRSDDDSSFYERPLKGTHTVVYVLLQYGSGSEICPAFYLQAFENERFRGEYIKINGEKHLLKKLEDLIVFKDKDVVIYNFYSLIEEMTTDDRIVNSINGTNEGIHRSVEAGNWPPDRRPPIYLALGDYDGLRETLHYLEEHISEMIAKKKQS